MSEDSVKLVDQSIFIEAAPEMVYELISDATKLGDWLFVDGSKESTSFGVGPYCRPLESLDIADSVPGKRVLFAWSRRGVTPQRMPDSTVEILLEPQASGTIVRVQQFVASKVDDTAGIFTNECIVALGKRITEAFHTPLPVPRVLEKTAAIAFMEPRFAEGVFAYARRRVVCSLSAATVVGTITVSNLMLVNRGASSLQSAVAWASLALALLLVNVLLQTVIGLALRDAGRAQKGTLLLLSGLATLASCYVFFWPAAGTAFGGNERATIWIAIALATPVLVLLYAQAFNFVVARRGLWHPADGSERSRRFGLRSLVLTLACCCCPSLHADEPAPQVAKKIHDLVAKRYAMDEPGAAVLVAKGDQVILSRGYGVANVERREPITEDTLFCIASVTKPITATAVLRLVERGRLKLDQQIVDILPGYPRHAAGITIAHLLSHTAGIPDVSRLPKWRADMQSELAVSQILEHFQELPLSFAPGEKWQYSNSGYLLLGAVIERAAGTTYGDLLQKEIFTPADMKRSYYGPRDNRSRLHALGYQRGGEGYVEATPVSLSRPFAAGGVVSSAKELFAFSRALMASRLISRETMEEAFAPRQLKSGKPTTYGYGWMVGSFHGHRLVQHAGGMPGYTSQMWLLPDEEIFAVLLSNSPDKTDQKLIGQIALLALGKSDDVQKTIQLDASTLEKYVGRYQLSEFGNDLITVSLTGSRLTMHVPPNPVCELHATAPTEFFVAEEDIQLTFVVTADGVAQSVVLHHGGLDLRATRLDD